jgi:2-hydroxychromene-2-carboxylate isomerase
MWLASLAFLISAAGAAQPEKPVPDLELYMMSQCPFGVRAEQILLPLLSARQLRWHLYFIAEEQGVERDAGVPPAPPVPETPVAESGCQATEVQGNGRFASLHGQSEVEEDLRQTVIAQFFADKLGAYLLERSRDYRSSDWRTAARAAGLDAAEIDQLAADSATEELFAINIARGFEKGFKSSPTMVYEGRTFRGGSGALALARELCRGEECDRLPGCAEDADCAAAGKVGRCRNALEDAARCELRDPVHFQILAVTSDFCPVCRFEELFRQFAGWFPGSELKIVRYPSLEAEALVRRFGLNQLPAFLFEARVERELNFDRLRSNVEPLGDYFLLDPWLNNASHVLERPERLGQIELFADSQSPAAREAELGYLNYLEGRGQAGSYGRHPLVIAEGGGQVSSPFGASDLEESGRRFCINRLAPASSAAYVRCRLQRPELEWQGCLAGGLEPAAIGACAQGAAARAYLAQEAQLNERLGVVSTPSYLINNVLLLRGVPLEGALTLYELFNQPGRAAGQPWTTGTGTEFPTDMPTFSEQN